MLYAFCREADDIIDGGASDGAAAMNGLRDRLSAVYAGAADPSNPVDRALAIVVATHRIPRALFEALLEGLQWDAEGRRYETLDELLAYAARVAGSVGAIMTLIMGIRTAGVVSLGCEMGVAMQLTNIARDVGEDARRGRLYLPLSWMREAGEDPDRWLADPRASAAVRATVARLLGEADHLYAGSELGIAGLPADCRTAIRTAGLVYADIGRSVAIAQFDSVSRRAVVTTWRKAWLLSRAFLAPVRAPRCLPSPPLEPTKFLVTESLRAP